MFEIVYFILVKVTAQAGLVRKIIMPIAKIASRIALHNQIRLNVLHSRDFIITLLCQKSTVKFVFFTWRYTERQPKEVHR